MERNWRTAAVAASVLFVLVTAWGASQLKARRETERQLSARYQERFFEAVGHIENVEALLAKGLLVLSPKKRSNELSVTLFSDIWRQAFAAQANLTQLPLLQGTLLRTGKFLTQVGDFSYFVARKVSSGQELGSDEMGKLAEFRREAAILNSALRSAQVSASRGAMPWSQLQRQTNVRLLQRSKQIDDNDFVRLEKQAVEFPTIIYDGPFSDHITQREPRGLTGSNESEGRAEQIALNFMPAERKDNLVAESIGKANGAIPAYQIHIRRAGQDREIARLDVSRKGGHVIWMLNSRAVGTPTLELEQAGRKAKDFLVKRGFEHIVPTYANQSGGRATIPFAPLQDGVIIYPDLVKVTVALDNGEIIGYEALGYLMNHHSRSLPQAKITVEQALESVSPDLRIEGGPQLALIPLETLEEVLTYEVKGRHGDEFFVNYVDVQTGELIRILQIVDTPDGRMAI